MTLYFDPGPVLGEDREVFRGRWEDCLWLNVSGPLYGGETDTCRTGRITQYLSDHDWASIDWAEQGVAEAVRDYESYMAGGLATDLRVYLYWLEEGTTG
ncbi:hypothetical protein ACFVVU_06670 [Kitasatospora sp. NPDC057965]|uniref:hypothetical protein n=1 Tax=Kitasatospora sp. NPDC057965 TaxID=3346291 RepID=UPI0036D8D6EF